MLAARPARAVVVVLAVALVGCTVPEEGGGRSSTTTSLDLSVPPSPRPEVGQCRGLITTEIIQAPSDVRPPISCDETHGSETVSVDELSPEVASLSHREVAELSAASPALRPIVEQCQADFEEYVGVARVAPDAVRESNLSQAFFIPGFEDWARGARWVRCEAVTPPLNGIPTRGVSGRLRGILDLQPLPPVLASCFRSVTAPPQLAFDFPVSCDQPHAAEAVLRFPVTDPRVDEFDGDPARLGEFVRTELGQPCTERIATVAGVSAQALAERTDLTVASRPLGLLSWGSDPKARRVQCLAYTARPSVGTLDGLGDRPLPLP